MENYWDLFCQTGQPVFYLYYQSTREMERDD